jgi:hypothetical protein
MNGTLASSISTLSTSSTMAMHSPRSRVAGSAAGREAMARRRSSPAAALRLLYTAARGRSRVVEDQFLRGAVGHVAAVSVPARVQAELVRHDPDLQPERAETGRRASASRAAGYSLAVTICTGTRAGAAVAAASAAASVLPSPVAISTRRRPSSARGSGWVGGRCPVWRREDFERANPLPAAHPPCRGARAAGAALHFDRDCSEDN